MSDINMITKNRKARFNYEILESLEAGIVLTGTEVKSVRAGHISLQEAYVVPQSGELWLQGARINPYEQGNINNHDPDRRRKLLLKKGEIEKLTKRVQEKGLTLVPLSAYFKGRHLKIEVGVARGKQRHDKRESIKQREVDRRIRQIQS